MSRGGWCRQDAGRTIDARMSVRIPTRRDYRETSRRPCHASRRVCQQYIRPAHFSSLSKLSLSIPPSKRLSHATPSSATWNALQYALNDTGATVEDPPWPPVQHSLPSSPPPVHTQNTTHVVHTYPPLARSRPLTLPWYTACRTRLSPMSSPSVVVVVRRVRGMSFDMLALCRTSFIAFLAGRRTPGSLRRTDTYTSCGWERQPSGGLSCT